MKEVFVIAPKMRPLEPFDEKAFHVLAGANKFGVVYCPMCGMKPMRMPQPLDIHDNDAPMVFQFRNEISCKEYRISGMCQPCQDEIFGVD